MCGIVGVLSSDPTASSKDRERFFRSALIVDQIRGFHSTGFFKVNQPYGNSAHLGTVYTAKKAFCANDFLEIKQVDQMLTGLGNTDILIGHNRWATMGSIAHHTAHPFTHGDVTLVHNGTLHWFQDIDKNNMFDIDSEAICYALSQVEPDKAHTVLELLDGAYALIWYDARIGKVRAARNSERPLHFCFSKDNKDLLIASESGMLQWLADRHGFKPQEVWQLKEGVMITVDRDDLTSYETKEFTPYEDNYNSYGFGNAYDARWKSKQQKRLENKSSKKDDEDLTTPLTKSYGLANGGSVCFDPVEFVFYPKNSADQSAQWGKLIGKVQTPSGAFLNCEVDGLTHKAHGEMVGYSITAKVIQVLDIIEDNKAKKVLKLMEPDYLMDDTESENYELEGSKDGVITVEDHDRYGPFNTYITEARWLQLKDNGCAMCGGDIGDEDDDITGWDSQGQPICRDCLELNGWQDITPEI